MAQPSARKVTFALKAQLKALMSWERAPGSTTTGELGALELRAPLEDTRIAAWLLDPDQVKTPLCCLNESHPSSCGVCICRDQVKAYDA
jgi:hypothetical protein